MYCTSSLKKIIYCRLKWKITSTHSSCYERSLSSGYGLFLWAFQRLETIRKRGRGIGVGLLGVKMRGFGVNSAVFWSVASSYWRVIIVIGLIVRTIKTRDKHTLLLKHNIWLSVSQRIISLWYLWDPGSLWCSSAGTWSFWLSASIGESHSHPEG